MLLQLDIACLSFVSSFHRLKTSVEKCNWIILRQSRQPLNIPLRPHFRFLDNGNSAVLNNNVVWHSKSPQSFRNLIVSLYTYFSEQTLGFTFPQTVRQQIRILKPPSTGFHSILRKPDRPL